MARLQSQAQEMRPEAAGSHSTRTQYLVWGLCLPLIAPLLASSTKMEPSMQLASRCSAVLHRIGASVAHAVMDMRLETTLVAQQLLASTTRVAFMQLGAGAASVGSYARKN